MNLLAIKQQDFRRMVLWFLYYDTDYQLSETMLHSCFEMYGKNLSFDQLQNTIAWLCEQGLTESKNIACSDFVTLTDRGLEVAKGQVKTIGVRDLRPSELAEIKAFKGY